MRVDEALDRGDDRRKKNRGEEEDGEKREREVFLLLLPLYRFSLLVFELTIKFLPT